MLFSSVDDVDDVHRASRALKHFSGEFTIGGQVLVDGYVVIANHAFFNQLEPEIC